MKKKFVTPMVTEISNVFGAGTNTCVSTGSGNNNQCTTSGK